MADKTKIQWADASWSPITGCTKISEACGNCYAERMAYRFAGHNGYPPRPNHFDVTFHPGRLDQPLKWKRPRRIFVCSMSDIFHANVKKQWIDDILEVIAACPQHTFMLLTKRPENMDSKFYGFDSDENPVRELGGGDYLPNISLGFTAENQEMFDRRIDKAFTVPAGGYFVSLEPLLGPINLGLPEYQRGYSSHSTRRAFLNHVIVGGESGPNARPMHPGWVRSIRDQCDEAGVPFLFKQWGEYCAPSQMSKEAKLAWEISDYKKHPGLKWDDRDHDNPKLGRIGKKAAGNALDGQTHMEIPE